MVIFPSSTVASVMNKMLRNVTGTTTASGDSASADGLICAEDLSNILQCGQSVSDALTKNPAMFQNLVTGMLETIADVYYETISSDEYDMNKYGLEVSRGEFACLKEKVRIDSTEFEASFVLDTQASSTFDDLFGKHPMNFDVKVWGNKGFYRTKPFSISREMLKTSVQSENGFERLIAECWKTLDSIMDVAVAGSPYFLIKQQIANAAMYRGGVRVVNLVDEFTKSGGTWVSETDPAFAKWFVKYQRHLRKLMARITNKYSGKPTIKMNTPKFYERAFLIDTFYDNINDGLSGVYHDNKIGNIDDYELEPYIENVNEPRSINIIPANPPVITSGKHVTGVVFGGTIVGMIWDRRGTFWNTEYRKVADNPNRFDDHVNYISTVGAQHCVDEDSNVVVFVVDATKTGTNYNKGYTITEETDGE